VPHLQYKRFDVPDQVRSMPRGHAQIVSIDEATVGRARWEPGWRWSVDLAPIAGTRTCEIHHLGYSISGTLHVITDDGQAVDIPPDSVYEIPSGHDAWVVGDEPWETVEWTSAREVGVELEGPGERVLATLLFTDIVESTATLERIGDTAWRERLIAHNARLREELNRFRGREVTTTGDGFLAVFDGATRAVRCAAAMTRSAQDVGLSIRVGVHSGEVEFIGGDARGLAVHAAARVMSLAGPGEVLLSSTTADLLEGSGLTLEDAGAHDLKGLSGPRRIWRLVMLPRADAPARTEGRLV
jgi:class 3 adenylate cyclase